MAFGEVAGASTLWQVARNFSALLQLVNAGNVGVKRGAWAGVGAAADTALGQSFGGHAFKLRLLCLVPAHQRFEDLAFGSQPPATVGAPVMCLAGPWLG